MSALPPQPGLHVVVLGLGVSGLTTAALLLEAGCSVELWGESQGQAPPHALWECPPYHCDPPDVMAELALVSLEVFKQIHASHGPSAGVELSRSCAVRKGPLSENAYGEAGRLDDYLRGALARRALCPGVLVDGRYDDPSVDAVSFGAPILDTRQYVDERRQEREREREREREIPSTQPACV